MERKVKIFLATFIALMLFCAIAIVAVLIGPRQNITDGDTDSIERYVVKNVNQLKNDADADGLKDWEEELWKTDANNPDTDSDGTRDGDEIATNRDPRKPGPNDTINFNIQQRELGIIQATSYIKQQTEVVNKPDPSKNTGSTASPSVENPLKTYGNSIASILRAHFSSVDNEAAIFSAVIEKEQKEDLSKLLPIAQKYRDLSEQINKTAVPESAKQLQQDLSLAYREIAAEMEELVQNEANFTKEATFFEEYSASVNKYGTVFYAYMDYFKKNGVRFAPNEPGYLFTPSF